MNRENLPIFYMFFEELFSKYKSFYSSLLFIFLMTLLSFRACNVQESATLAIGARAKALKAVGKKIIDFSLGEPDFPTPQQVKDAAVHAIKENFTYYTAASGIPELKQAIATKFQQENNLLYTPEQIMVSNGAKHSLMNVFLVLLNKGDEVIIPAPYWTSYPEMVKLAEGIPVFCSTDTSFHLTVDAVAKKITQKTKLLILNSPCNPTGAVIPKEELKKIAALCVKRKIFVVSDEVYEHFCYALNKHLSIASLGKEIFLQTITVNAVSKTYSMTGWRIGYCAGPQEIVQKMSSIQSQMTSCPNSIAQKAAVAALTGDQSQIQRMITAFDERRKYMVQRFHKIEGISCELPEGAFYLFAKIPKGISSEAFCMKLLQQTGVATVPGSAFGAEGYFRLSYATDMNTIKEGCDTIEQFCKNFKE